MEQLLGGSPWTAALPGTNPAGITEILGPTGGASTSLVGGGGGGMNMETSARSSMFLALHFLALCALIVSAPKPMETWCGEDVTMGNSWDQEEEVEIGMWSNSQLDNRSHDQNTWNYKHKGSNKVVQHEL